MATDVPESLSKDKELFISEIYNYIWKRHKFRTVVLEESFANKSCLANQEPKADEELINKIGGAVICSQYLFREYCECIFKRYESGPINTNMFFYECVFEVITIWLRNRKNIFMKVIDSLAIIAEAILYCDAELNTAIELNKAPEMFCTFFGRYLLTDFFEKGSWLGLQEEVDRCYSNMHSILSQFIQDNKEPYKKLHHDCYLMQNLKNIRMVFPFSISMFCTQCSDVEFCGCNRREEIFYKTLKKIWNENFVGKEETWKNIKYMKNKFRNDLQKDNSRKEDHIHNGDCFQFLLIGKKEKIKKRGRKRKPKHGKSSELSGDV